MDKEIGGVKKILNDQAKTDILLVSDGFTPTAMVELLPKAFELRVAIVGQHIFAARTRPPDSNFAAIDWRPPNVIQQLKHELATLDRTTVDHCRALIEDTRYRKGGE